MRTRKVRIPQKLFYYQKNLERILATHRMIRQISYGFHKDRIYLNAIPELFWSKIMEKMSVSSLLNCHTATYNLHQIALRLNPRHNRIKASLYINIEDHGASSYIAVPSRPKELWSLDLNNMDPFWKSANCWSFGKIFIYFAQDCPDVEIFEESIHNVHQFSEEISFTMTEAQIKKLAKYFPSKIATYCYHMNPEEHIWKEFKESECIKVKVDGSLPFELAKNYTEVTPIQVQSLQYTSYEKVIRFFEEFSKEEDHNIRLRRVHLNTAYRITLRYLSKFIVIYEEGLDLAHYNTIFTGLISRAVCMKKVKLGIIMIQSIWYPTTFTHYFVGTLCKNMEELYFMMIEDLTDLNILHWHPVDFSEYLEEFISTDIGGLKAVLKKIVCPHVFPNNLSLFLISLSTEMYFWKERIPRKVWYHSKNLETILLTHRLLKQIAYGFQKDQIYLNAIPELFWPKILQKMDVPSILNCHSVCKEFQKIASDLDPRHNVINSQINIYLYVEKIDIKFGSCRKILQEIDELKSFWKTASCWTIKEIFIHGSYSTEVEWNTLLKSIQDVVHNNLIYYLIPAEGVKKICKHFSSKIVMLYYEATYDANIWKEFKRGEKLEMIMVPYNILAFETAKNYTKLMPASNLIGDTDEILQFIRQFANEKDKKMRLRTFSFTVARRMSVEDFDGFSQLYKIEVNSQSNTAEESTGYIKKTELGILLIRLSKYLNSYYIWVRLSKSLEKLYELLMDELTGFYRLQWNPVDFSEYFEEFMSTEIEGLEAVLKKIIEPHTFRYIDNVEII